MRKTLLCLTGMILLYAGLINVKEDVKRDTNNRKIETSDGLESLLSYNPYSTKIEKIDDEKIRKILMANETFDTKFSDDNVEFELYVSNWKPNLINARESYRHTPDVCWKGTGWTCIAGESAKNYEIAGIKLKPAEWRRFYSPREEQEVLYWCLLGKEIFQYPKYSKYDQSGQIRVGIKGFFLESSFIKYWRDIINKSNLKPEEKVIYSVKDDIYFIRINSKENIETLSKNKMFQYEIKNLESIGLSINN